MASACTAARATCAGEDGVGVRRPRYWTYTYWIGHAHNKHHTCRSRRAYGVEWVSNLASTDANHQVVSELRRGDTLEAHLVAEVVDGSKEVLLGDGRVLLAKGFHRSFSTGATPIIVAVHLTRGRWTALVRIGDNRELEDDAEDAVAPLDRGVAVRGDGLDSWGHVGAVELLDLAGEEGDVVRLAHGLADEGQAVLMEWAGAGGSPGRSAKKSGGRRDRCTAGRREEDLVVQQPVRSALPVQLSEGLAGARVGADTD